MFSDRIKNFAEEYGVEDLVLRYDADFDVPMQHKYAIGILQMVGAFEPVPHQDWQAMARRVGAFWCDIVRCDTAYALVDGLRLIEASRADADRLHASLGTTAAGQTFPRYATSRWFDGSGKIRYRLGSYTRARISFEMAVNTALAGELWWCLPDMRSNLLRAQFEERKQTASADPERGVDQVRNLIAGLVADLRDERKRAWADAAAREVQIDSVSPGDQVRIREFARGCSSVLHNLAVALKEEGSRDESLVVSRDSRRISDQLSDGYRVGQSLNHQAQVDGENALRLYEQLREGPWLRGRLIAKQRLAGLQGGAKGAEEIRALLDELAESDVVGYGAGTDIEIHAYTVQTYGEILRHAGERIDSSALKGFEQNLDQQRLNMARSVRRVVAIPSYKRAYAVAVRPSYLEQVAALIGSPVDEARPFDVAKKAEDIEAALGLTEESSARELLDMLSAGALPEMKIPASAAAPLAASSPEHPVGTGSAEPDLDGETRRRAGVRRADSADDDALRRDLARRETEFEEQFLRRPLEAVPHDPEIAHRVRMFTANSPGTCVVRYFSYGPRRPTGMGAFVFRGNRVTCVAGISYEQVRGLAEDLSTDNAPTKQDSERIWQLLLNPVWDAVTAGGDPSHLIIVPADDIFSIPIHVASPPGESTWPLAASVPLSQSVSATALVGRGRHLLRRQPVDQDDELAAIVVADEKVTGDELRLAGWPASRMLIAGDRPAGLEHIQRHYRADLQGIAALSETKPEFFVYAGHGSYHPSFPQLGPFLELRGNYLTQYDVALRLRLPRNKLTVLGACLAGQGASTSGGDVVGFLRSLIATGAGAVGIPLWSVLDLEMATTVGALLAASRAALSNDDSVFDVVAALHAQYRDSAADASSFKMLAECMPIELYL